MLRSLIFYFLFCLWTLIAIIIALPFSLVSADWIHTIAIFWGRICLKLAGLQLLVEGRENISTSGPAIYVSNHQSNFDIPVLYAGLPIQFRWLAKQELFRVPLFGLAMKRCGYIAIDRSDRRKAMHSLNQAAHKIKSGTSVIIFPEGTRTDDGQVQPFKKGALVIAAKAQVPVIPVAITGSYQVQPKSTWLVGRAPLKLTFFPPVETENLKVSGVAGLTENIRAQIAEAVKGEAQYAG